MSDNAAFEEPQNDPVFQQEQQHLTETYATLRALANSLASKLKDNERAAAMDKSAMVEDIAPDFSSFDVALETYAAYAAVNRIIEGYNVAQGSTERKLSDVSLLLQQPYFAKVVLQFKPDEEPKELYIGAAGVSDENCKRLVVDWRSPVAEVYYNQDEGATSYRANGRTINVNLQLRRQFDIERDRLNAYFDTSIAIQDSLLLASLSKQRSAQMQAITSTIQKEQNVVVRHDDVPALLVNGIAGSGKTSVLLQRIAYLFYQQRESLDPRQVFLLSPNPVFRTYIENVLPDLGERNPETVTWREFAARVMPADRAQGKVDAPLETLRAVDAALADFAFDSDDFKDILHEGKKLITVAQIRSAANKFRKIPAGPRLVTLMREELLARLDSRMKQMANTEAVLDEIAALDINEQLALFGEIVEPQDEKEERVWAMRYLKLKFADARAAVENDEWLRIDRIGMRLLDAQSLEPVTWLYVKMAITGLGNADAKYVMIDEVQDYTPAQLAALARYFRRAHFLLLGDANQAIKEGTATFEQVRDVFAWQRGDVEECRLMTSYRSTPEITALFARLLPPDEQMHVQSIQREETAPVIKECASNEEWENALRAAVREAAAAEGTCAVIAPHSHAAKKLQETLGDEAPILVGEADALPDAGVALISLKLAKGLEFDSVIVPDASEAAFPETDLARRRLYTTISRATRRITLLARGKITPLLR